MTAHPASAFFPVRVHRKTRLTEHIAGFELVPADDAPLPPFAAGAHIDVALPNGLVRQYSLCNPPGQVGAYEIGVLLAPAGRGGSASAHQDIAEGDIVRIGVPRNHFPLVPAARSLLFAGGIGITPLLSMAWALHRGGADFALHYCMRRRAGAAYLERLADAPFAPRVHCHPDDEPAHRLDAATLLAAPTPGTHLYVCGPQGFMDHVIATARAHGWPDDHLHFEYFAAPAPQADAPAGSFEVCVPSRGVVAHVPPDRSVAQTLLAHGVPVALSCEQGICGSCLMRVLEGQPEHRDLFLSDAEKAANDRILPCCSRARGGRLVIDF